MCGRASHAAIAPALVSFFSRLCRKLASRSSRAPSMLQGTTSPSTGEMGIWSPSSFSEFYMYHQKTNSGRSTATCMRRCC